MNRLNLLLNQLKQKRHMDDSQMRINITMNKLNNKNQDDNILYISHSNQVVEILLNQPSKLNSLDHDMNMNLLNTVKNWVNFDYKFPNQLSKELEKYKPQLINTPSVILMAGVGKAFCAGGDIKTLYQNRINEKGIFQNQTFLNYEFVLDYFIAKLIPLQIVYWNGPVMGGGVGISINAPIRIATENTLFAMPELEIGLFPDVGATWFLPRIFNNNYHLGLYVGLTGHRIKARDLVKCGVATHFMTSNNYTKFKQDIILFMGKNQLNKREDIITLVNYFSELSYNRNSFHFDNLDLINKYFDIDSLSNIFKRLNQAKNTKLGETEEKFVNKTLDILSKASPTSMVVFFEQFIRGIKLTNIEKAYEIENQLADVFMENKDFYEGVRAKLIERTNDAKWEYKSISDIDEKEMINKYFEVKSKQNVEKFKYPDSN